MSISGSRSRRNDTERSVKDMKMVRAIIKPERFESVKKALEENGFCGMTVAEVEGRGEQKGITLEYRGGLMTVDFLPKIQIEMVVPYNRVDHLVSTLSEACRTGKVGDGRIFVMPVEKAIRIRTGESQEEAMPEGMTGIASPAISDRIATEE